MPGLMTHSPAEVLQQLLIDLQLGTAPEVAKRWPVYSPDLTDVPDECIATTETTGSDQGKTQVDSERQDWQGVQIRVRGKTDRIAYKKAWAIAIAMDSVRRQTVHVETYRYRVWTVQRVSFMRMGADVPDSRRYSYSVNVLVSVRQLP